MSARDLDGGGAWRIVDWDKFENSRSRPVRYCQFVAVPIVLQDVRYARLMRQPNGAAAFGVYIALVQWHMASFGGDVRGGWLTDDGNEWGEPLCVDDLAAYLKMDDVTVSVALDVLSAPAVGWLARPCGDGAESVQDCGRCSALTRVGGTRDCGQRTEKEGEEVVGDSRGRARGGPTTLAGRGEGGRRTEDRGPRSATPPPPADAGDTDGLTEEEGHGPTPPPPADAGDLDGGGRTENGEAGTGERSAPEEPGRGEGYERETPQHPPRGPRRFDPEAAALVEIPCRDGVFFVPVETLKRYVLAYPDVDVTAQLLRMQDWAFSKLEAGGSEAQKAWSTDVAPAGVTGWIAEEQKKAEDRANGGPAVGVGARGSAGAGRTTWRGEIEALDKQKRAINQQAQALCDKYGFNDDPENRRAKPNAWAKVRSLRGQVEAINARMANVRRED